MAGNEFDPDALGARIRTRREELGLVQEDLAAAAGVRGLAISDIELGKTQNPKTQTLAAIAARLGVSLDELVTGKKPPAPSESILDRSEADEVPIDYRERIDAVVARKGYPAEVGTRLRAMFKYTGSLDGFELEANAAIVARQLTGTEKIADKSQDVKVTPRAGTMKLEDPPKKGKP